MKSRMSASVDSARSRRLFSFACRAIDHRTPATPVFSNDKPQSAAERTADGLNQLAPNSPSPLRQQLDE